MSFIEQKHYIINYYKMSRKIVGYVEKFTKIKIFRFQNNIIFPTGYLLK